MTPIEFQDALATEIRYILKPYAYKTPAGERASMNVFTQSIPVQQTDDEEDPFPYVIVRDVLNVVQKIYERFSENPCLNKLAAYTGDFQWMLQEDNYYPYHFGACHMKFNIAAVRREDPLA